MTDPHPVRLREYFTAALVYLSLLVAATWPLAARFLTEVPGHPWLAIKIHLWQFWWTREALLNPDWSLCHTPLLCFPDGVNTLTEMGNFFLPLLGIPPQMLLGLAAGFNAVFFLVFTATGVATYALCRRFVDSIPACLAGGAAAVFLPYAWMKVFDGEFEIAVLLWIPIGLIQLDRVIRRPDLVQGALLGLVIFLATMSSWYYGLFLALTVALGMGVAVVRVLRDSKSEGLPIRCSMFDVRCSMFDWKSSTARRLVAAALAALALYGALVAPFAAALHHTERVADLNWREECAEWDLTAKANPDVLELVGPWQRAPTEKAMAAVADDGIPYPFAIFPGFVSGILALIGLTAGRRLPRHLRAAAVVFWLLSLGPWLKIAGTTYLLPFRIRLPAYYLAAAWEGFAAITIHSYRAAVVLLVVLCVPAAIGFDRLCDRLSVRGRAQAMLCALVLVLMARDGLDAAHIPFPLRRTAALPPPVYNALAEAPGDGAVLNIPLTEVDHIAGDYLLAQTVHRRPILASRRYEGAIAEHWKTLPAVLRYRPAAQRNVAPEAIPDADARALAADLAEGGVGVLVVHWNHLSDPQAEAVRGLMERIGDPLADDPERGITIYRLAASAARP